MTPFLWRRRARAARAIVWLAALVAAGAPSARACNLCLEDKVAATYDWQVVSAASRRGHVVVFSAIQGRLTPGDRALEKSLTQRLGAAAGVDAGTVRISLEPQAASFACDPARNPPARVVAAMNRALRPSGLKLAIVRIGAPGAASSSAR